MNMKPTTRGWGGSCQKAFRLPLASSSFDYKWVSVTRSKQEEDSRHRLEKGWEKRRRFLVKLSGWEVAIVSGLVVVRSGASAGGKQSPEKRPECIRVATASCNPKLTQNYTAERRSHGRFHRCRRRAPHDPATSFAFGSPIPATGEPTETDNSLQIEPNARQFRTGNWQHFKLLF